MTEEPEVVAPERVFEQSVVAAVHDLLRKADYCYAIVPKFGLDVGIFVSDKDGPYVRFLEAKCYSVGRAGGVGFGDRYGSGPQVDILLCPEGDSHVIDDAVRWILVDATREWHTARYALFDCLAARAAAMGGPSRGKQNNLRISQLQKGLFDVGAIDGRDFDLLAQEKKTVYVVRADAMKREWFACDEVGSETASRALLNML